MVRDKPLRQQRYADWSATLIAGLALATLVVVTPLAGYAGPTEQQRRDTAARLGTEGIKLYIKGEYERALAKFERAHQSFPAPTLGLRAARCLAKLGRLVEATKRYDAVIATKLGPKAPYVHFEAKRQARQERNKLAASIPLLKVTIVGAPVKQVVVSVDGHPLAIRSIGKAIPIDPGRHEVRAQRGDATVRQKVELARGQTQTVVLKLPPVSAASALEPSADPRPTGLERGSSAYRIPGIIAVSIGAAGLVIGTVSGAVALAQQSSLEERCPERNCGPDDHRAADWYDTSRALATAGFVLAGVGVAAGTTLLLLDASADEGDGATENRTALRVRPWVGLAGIGVRGSF